ncbi:YjcZ family sporulation protein [Paenibacillus sp. Marseille-Q4541]|nr:YjcZ family sporulation protein [Paenibacillus sp. Marseille-Q4541]
MSEEKRNGGYGYGCGESGFGGGGYQSIGAILVLFILLVIISRAFSW